MIWSSPVIWGLDPSRDPVRGTPRAVQRWLRVSYLGYRAQTSGWAQGMAQALPGLLTVPGCSGFGVQPPDGVQPLGVRQHVALPLTGEFAADVGVLNMVLSCLLGSGVLALWTIRRAVQPGAAGGRCGAAGLAARPAGQARAGLVAGIWAHCWCGALAGWAG
jgi:hypothetical protein